MDNEKIAIRSVLSKIEQTFIPVGSTIGKYTVIGEIDHGGMAVVYKALQLDLDREVALKVMPAGISINPRFLERFLSEAHAVARLNHPNIVAIHEVSTENNIYFLVMDYIPGKNLYFYLNDFKPKLVDVINIVITLTEALAYAHNQRIIHRDLKLNNVIMKNNEIPVLIDFGLAKTLEEDGGNITRTGEVVGSPAYMAPERILGGHVDQRSDICSLGIMLYEMLTFKNPYLDQRSIHQTTLNIMEANPIPPRKLIPWLPSEIEAITLKALHGDPSKRYQTMEEMREDLLRFRKGDVVLAQLPSMFVRLKHIVRRYWPYLAITGLVLLFSLLFGFSYYIQREKGKSHWQLVFHEKFNRREIGDEWFYPDTPPADSTGWSVHDGVLFGRSGGFSYLRLQQPFTRDMRMEFDVFSTTDDLFGAGAFLYGDCPDSGYAFHIFRGGRHEHGMTFPGSSILLKDYNPLDFPAQRRYRVEIERKETMLVFRLNGVTIVRRWDLFPPLGDRHRNFGFFVQGSSCAFDNLKIYQRAIPISPGPTLIANRLWERGDFQAALEEYSGLRLDFSHADITREILVRVPDCLIRMGHTHEALERLSSFPPALYKTGARAEISFLQATAHELLGNKETADSIYGMLSGHSPQIAASHSATTALIRQYEHLVEKGQLDRADQKLTALAVRSVRSPRELAMLHLSIADTYLRTGQIDKALAIGKNTAELYAADDRIHSEALVCIARGYLCKRQKQKAIDVLNQCIARHIFTEGVWKAWMQLAAIYEYDFNFRDALTIYRKIYRECPRGIALPWMARLKMGEVAQKTSCEESPDSIFNEIIRMDHPFPVPRMIARYYRGEVAESQFLAGWARFFPHDKAYLYHFASKAILERELVVAKVYLQEYLQNLSRGSWRYLEVYKIISSLDKP